MIGILAVQGDFREHELAYRRVGVPTRRVRRAEDLEGVRGLVIPGGESTTIGKLAREYGVEAEARRRYEAGTLALWGTCAGAIWLAREVEGYPDQPRLGVMEIAVRRNAYGRQVESFETDLEVEGFDRPFHAIFIRAPVITRVGPGLRVLARYQGDPVFVVGERLMATTFHPELTEDPRVHLYFARLAGAEEAARVG
ncbi:MAG TPA: pyridoxal 5'-phosphate synthase glutaminase subunit PdxT [Oceanithermus sp.]|nr:pyridoxal 5'-phosphate synthase glutaminase subunit PdxT [Oceanithermus sp.]